MGYGRRAGGDDAQDARTAALGRGFITEPRLGRHALHPECIANVSLPRMPYVGTEIPVQRWKAGSPRHQDTGADALSSISGGTEQMEQTKRTERPELTKEMNKQGSPTTRRSANENEQGKQTEPKRGRRGVCVYVSLVYAAARCSTD